MQLQLCIPAISWYSKLIRVDLERFCLYLHRDHCLESTFCLSAPSRKRIRQRAWCDLAGEAPAVLAPTTRGFFATIADDRIPVAVRLRLIVRCDLEGERPVVLDRRTAVETKTGNAEDGELTVIPSPALPPG